MAKIRTKKRGAEAPLSPNYATNQKLSIQVLRNAFRVQVLGQVVRHIVFAAYLFDFKLSFKFKFNFPLTFDFKLSFTFRF